MSRSGGSSGTNYAKIGFLVTVGAVIALAAIFWFGALRFSGETYTAYAYFDEPVSGLEIGSPVKFRGVTIGNVAEIATGPDHRHVEVRAEILAKALERLGLREPGEEVGPDSDKPFVPPDLRVQLVSSLLTGVTYIQSDFFDTKKYPIPDYPFEVPWNTVHSVPSTYKSLESGVVEILEALPKVTERTADLLDRVDSSLQEAQIAELSRSVRELLDAARRELDVLRDNEVVARSARTLAAIEEAANSANYALDDVTADDGAFQGALRRVDALGAALEDEIRGAGLADALAAIARAADRLSDAGDRLSRESDTLAETLAAVRRLVDLLERDPGSLLRGRASPTPPAERARRND
jgi:ABC-type transporter Mla subunit MlaD